MFPTAADNAPGGHVRAQSHGPVRVLTMGNQGRANAIDDALRRGLLAELEAAVGDQSVRAVVLTGAGDTFCAGGELRSMPVGDETALRRRLAEMHRIVTLVLTADKPVVAAVAGAAFGSGVSLAAAADMVVATDTSRFGVTFPRVGLAPDVALAWTLPRRVGPARARQLALRGAVLDGVEAHAFGLVDEFTPPADLLDTAIDRARQLGTGAPLALAATRRLFDAADLTLPDFLALEADTQVALWNSADFAEGRTAFLSRRSPRFVGR